MVFSTPPLKQYRAYGSASSTKYEVYRWVSSLLDTFPGDKWYSSPNLIPSRYRSLTRVKSEAHFFEPYVEGDMNAFRRYVAIKRQNAVWGDDPEVQALCEIYDRPAEIWSYDPQV